MDDSGGFGLSGVAKSLRKRRSNMNRRPPNEPELPQAYNDSISLSLTPSGHASDDVRETFAWNEQLNLNQSISGASYTDVAEAEVVQKSSGEDELLGDKPAAGSWKGTEMKENKVGEMVIGSHLPGQTGEGSDGIGTENKVRKVKLKVGGVTRTIHARSSSDVSSVAGSSATDTHSDSTNPPRKQGHQENLDSASEKGGLRGVPWKDFSKTGFSFEKLHIPRVDTPEESVKQTLKHGRSYKNKQVNKKFPSVEVYDDEEEEGEDDDDDDDDAEIRYLLKLKTSRTASFHDIGYENKTRVRKLRKISKVMDKSTQETTNSSSLIALEDIEYTKEEGSAPDSDIEPKSRKSRREATDDSDFSKRDSSITTRRRAIQTGRDNSPSFGASLIQFPDGLPPAPPRKQKEQLSEVEMQMKRTEAAQRRRMQNEKAALESQAEAIRKILGQDSSRKRREDKIKKRQEELAQERSANAATLAPDVVRWVMGPSGTVVTFPNELGLPCIFDSKPCSYPPPREKCAGPSCTNVYKYRDSKSNLPLCSLLCYKAIHEKKQTLTTC